MDVMHLHQRHVKTAQHGQHGVFVRLWVDVQHRIIRKDAAGFHHAEEALQRAHAENEKQAQRIAQLEQRSAVLPGYGLADRVRSVEFFVTESPGVEQHNSF